VPSRTAKGVPLAQIPGMTPSLLDPPPGCLFRQRCARATAACAADPALAGDPSTGAHVFRCHHPLEAA
jgi:peptide/nickel transport system ATP-binding protein